MGSRCPRRTQKKYRYVRSYGWLGNDAADRGTRLRLPVAAQSRPVQEIRQPAVRVRAVTGRLHPSARRGLSPAARHPQRGCPTWRPFPDTGIVQTPQFFRVADRQSWGERGADAARVALAAVAAFAVTESALFLSDLAAFDASCLLPLAVRLLFVPNHRPACRFSIRRVADPGSAIPRSGRWRLRCALHWRWLACWFSASGSAGLPITRHWRPPPPRSGRPTRLPTG